MSISGRLPAGPQMSMWDHLVAFALRCARLAARSSTLGLPMLTLGAPADAQGLDGRVSDAINGARAGGVVIVCRHGITDNNDEDEATLQYSDPLGQRRLSPAGEDQAGKLAVAFRSLGVATTEVVASPMQRTRRFAELIFDHVQLDSAWHTRGSDFSGPDRVHRLRMLSAPVSPGNRVIVTHIGTLYDLLPALRGQLDEGDCAVVRPMGNTHEVVGIVPWTAWLAASKFSPYHHLRGREPSRPPHVLEQAEHGDTRIRDPRIPRWRPTR